MQPFARLLTAGALALSLGCHRSATRADESLIAYGPSGSDTIGSIQPIAVPERYRVPPDILRDPEERMSLMQQLRRVIVAKTRQVSDDDYRSIVRPRVGRELFGAGFSPSDVQYLLADVDYARSLR
jgi:hypothetical protein